MLPALGIRPLPSNTSAYTALISPLSPPLFILVFASLSFISSVCRPSFLFQPSLPTIISPSSLLPSFLSFFFPSFSALSWNFYSLFLPLSFPSGHPLMLQEVPSLTGVERRRTCHVQKNLRCRHPACQGTIHRSCFCCCFQSTGASCVDCHTGVGTPKGSWETQHGVQRLETLTRVLAIVL